MSSTIPAGFNCPSCKQPHHVFVPEKTVMFVCGNCHAVVRVGANAIHSDYTLHKPKGSPLLRVGLQGMLKGKKYRVVAVAERYEVNTSYYWFEYTLMGDGDEEPVFLSTYDGHWNLLKPLTGGALPALVTNPNQSGVTWESDYFERFSRYTAKYNYACGEFYWQANLRKGVECVEYICPPRLLAVEINTNGPGETDIFGGVYISPGEVSKAFLHGEPLPKPVGIAPAQPPKLNIDARRFLVGTLVFCILVLIIQTLYVYSRKQLPVFNERMYMAYLDSANVNKPMVSPSFKLEGKTSNMEVQLETDVNNSWCEVEVNLVNEESGKETAFVVGAEYYSGVSEGEAWSEGSRMQKEFVCSVPPGSYHFVTTFNKDTNTPSVSLGLTVWWDVPTWWNAVIVSLVMALIAAVIWFVQRAFEAERWAGSNVIKHRN